MKKILKSKSGMTLIEMMVALLIFSIFATMVSATLVPILKQYIHTNELSELNTLLNNVTDDITESITNAVTVEVIKDLPSQTNEIVSDSLLCSTASGNVVVYKIIEKTKPDDSKVNVLNCSLDGGNTYYELYDEKYYKGKTLEMTSVSLVTNVVEIELTIKDDAVAGGSPTILFKRTIKARPIITPITR